MGVDEEQAIHPTAGTYKVLISASPGRAIDTPRRCRTAEFHEFGRQEQDRISNLAVTMEAAPVWERRPSLGRYHPHNMLLHFGAGR